MLLWLLSAVALLVAWASWARAGRLARKLEALSQSYWELRYDYTRLRSQVNRIEKGDAGDEEPVAPAPPAGQVTFVPLASMKKKS